MIFQFVAEHIHDGREGPSAIMAFKILDIFKDERRRSMMGDDLGRVEEKRALRIAQESVGSTERIFLGHPGDRKRRSEEHTSELQSLMRTSYADFCLKKKNKTQTPKI